MFSGREMHIHRGDGTLTLRDGAGADDNVLRHGPEQEAAAAGEHVRLGVVGDSLGDVIAKVMVEFSQEYSAGGARSVPASAWTSAQVADYLRTGTVPHGAPNNLDFMKKLFEAMARHLANADTSEGLDHLDRFLVALSGARTPNELSSLVSHYFAASGDGTVRFMPPPFAPAPGPDLTATRHCEAFRQASGLSPEVFSRLCEQLSPRAPFFEKVFSDPQHKLWGETFFAQVGRELAGCQSHEGAAVVLYHRDAYGVKRDKSGVEIPSTGITHISVIAFSPEGEVCVNHHESILFANTGAERNLMLGSLGLVSDSYNTQELFERAAQAYKDHPRRVEVPAELPMDTSFRLHGGPAGMMAHLNDFNGFRVHTLNEQRRSYSEEGTLRLYAADADPTIRRVAHEFETGQRDEAGLIAALGKRFPVQPTVVPPGGDQRESHVDYSNNCSLTTLLVLLAGGCPALVTPELISPSTPLYVLQRILLASRLLPDTPMYAPDRGSAASPGEQLNSKTFLILGSNQATHPGEEGTIPADIPSGSMVPGRAKL